MAEQRIPGRNGGATIISDSYAPFGVIQGPAEPADNPEKYRTVLLDDDKVCKRYNWNRQQLSDAIAHKEGGRLGSPRRSRNTW